MFQCRVTGSTSSRAHNTDMELPLVEPAQIPPVGSHSPSFSALCALAALLTVLEFLAAHLPAHLVQLNDYLFTQYDYWITAQLGLNHLHFLFLLIWRCAHANLNIITCTVFSARLHELKVTFPGILKLIAVRYGHFILGGNQPNWMRSPSGVCELQGERNRRASGGGRGSKGRGADPASSGVRAH